MDDNQSPHATYTVDPIDLEDFVREMQDKVIPEIVRVMRERAEAANANRFKVLS